MQWVRTNREHPCPVCGRDHYCSVSDDGEVICCTKVESDRPAKDRGWLHRLGPELKKNGHTLVKVGPITRFEIRGLAGDLVAVHCRQAVIKDGERDKDLWWERPGGERGLNGARSEALPLYGIDQLGEPNGRVVVVTEGEKDCEAIKELGIKAVGTVTGADGVPSSESLRALVGFDVCLWPDNDEKGRMHMARVGQRLVQLGASVRVLTWPEAPAKGGAFDFVEEGFGRDEISELYRAAVVLTPLSVPAGVVEYRLADLTPEDVHWLWRGRIPLAKITVLDGDPGLGKSTVTLDIAARVTRGERMPDGMVGDLDEPGAVLLLTAEDGLRDTVLPRLKALGADLSKVFALEAVPGEDGKPQMPAIPRDLEVIEERIKTHGVKLIIIDPLIAFLGDSSETNTWRDQDIRRALGPFAQMLERTGCASLLVRHLNKGSGGNPIYRGGGSIGIIGAARSGLLVQKDPDDDTGARRIMAPTKANLSAPAKAMAYHMETAANGSVRVVWDGETEHTAVGLLAEPLPEDERSALADAVEFLKGELYGNPVLASEIKRRAREADIAPRTLGRARAKLRVVSSKEHGTQGPWSLSLPILPGTRAAAKATAND